MSYIRIYTLRDGTEKENEKLKGGNDLSRGIKKLGISESDIFQMQLVIQDDKFNST